TAAPDRVTDLPALSTLLVHGNRFPVTADVVSGWKALTALSLSTDQNEDVAALADAARATRPAKPGDDVLSFLPDVLDGLSNLRTLFIVAPRAGRASPLSQVPIDPRKNALKPGFLT